MSKSDVSGNTEAEVDLCFDGNQLGFMDNFSLPFQLNSNFDEINSLQKSDSSHINVNQNSNVSGKKRAMLDAAALEASKKRFVWPDALHRDFLAAVFDIGLKYASPKELALLLDEQDTAAVNSDQIRSHIQKFSVFRERKEDYESFFDQQQRGKASRRSGKAEGNLTGDNGTKLPRSNSADVGGFSSARSPTNKNSSSHNNEDGHSDLTDASKQVSMSTNSNISQKSVQTLTPRAPPLVSPAALLARVDNLGEAIQLQNAYLTNIKQLVKKQSKMYAALVQKAQQLRTLLPPSQTTSEPPVFNAFNNFQVRNTCGTLYNMNIVTGDSSFGLSYIDNTTRNMFNESCNYNYYTECVAHLNFMRNGGVGANPNTTAHDMHNRSGLRFMQEMRDSMKVHRRQLIKKVDQLSQHGASGPLAKYGYDEGCTSGYNSFTDHHRYNGYVYTAEDNKLCYANNKDYSRTSTEGTYTTGDRSRSNSNGYQYSSSQYNSGLSSQGSSSNALASHAPAMHPSELVMGIYINNPQPPYGNNHYNPPSSSAGPYGANHSSTPLSSSKTSPEEERHRAAAAVSNGYDTYRSGNGGGGNGYSNGYLSDGIAAGPGGGGGGMGMYNYGGAGAGPGGGSAGGAPQLPAWETELDLDLFFFMADDPPGGAM